MNTVLTLIAHAPTQATRNAAFPRDEPIEAAGQAKAASLAGRLRRVDAAWTSPALRARQTAAALGLDAAAEPALRDIDHGAWAGRTLADLEAIVPDCVARWLTDPAAAPHGGESIMGLLARVSRWLDAVGGGSRLIAVTHPAVMRAALLHTLAAPPAAFWRIDVAPLDHLRLRGGGGRWTLVAMTSGRDAAG